MNNLPWMNGLPKMNAGAFTWDTYSADNSWLLGGGRTLPDGWIAIGYCDAADLSVRPKYGEIAVMFLDEHGNEFWMHMWMQEMCSC